MTKNLIVLAGFSVMLYWCYGSGVLFGPPCTQTITNQIGQERIM